MSTSSTKLTSPRARWLLWRSKRCVKPSSATALWRPRARVACFLAYRRIAQTKSQLGWARPQSSLDPRSIRASKGAFQASTVRRSAKSASKGSTVGQVGASASIPKVMPWTRPAKGFMVRILGLTSVSSSVSPFVLMTETSMTSARLPVPVVSVSRIKTSSRPNKLRMAASIFGSTLELSRVLVCTARHPLQRPCSRRCPAWTVRPQAPQVCVSVVFVTAPNLTNGVGRAPFPQNVSPLLSSRTNHNFVRTAVLHNHISPPTFTVKDHLSSMLGV